MSSRVYGDLRQARIHFRGVRGTTLTNCGLDVRSVDAREDWQTVDCKRCLRTRPDAAAATPRRES